MKIKIAYLFAAFVLLSNGFTFLEARAQQPAPDSAPSKTEADNGASREGRRQRRLEKFDLNHDGTLDSSEREKMRAAREEKIKQMGMGGGKRGGGRRMGFDGAGGGSGGAGGPGEGAGGPGDGTSSGPGSGPGELGRLVGPGGISSDGAGGMRHGMTDEQRQARRKRMLDRFDGNHDGKLDDSERAQMREQVGKMGGGGGRRHKRGDWGAGGAPGGGAPGLAPN